MKKYLLIILILSNFLISCNSDDEDNPQTLEPEVLTIDATVGANGGVNLSGGYETNGNTISEIGFEYSLDSLFNNRIVLNSELGSNNEIEYFLTNGIEENIKYFYKAFVKSSGKSFFGATKSFISNGSIAPEINSISNEFGIIGDTLEVYGRYFKDDNHQTFLDFSGISSEIISLNDSIIMCKVPTNIENIENNIRVKIDNREDSHSSFTLLKPHIESISPLNATFRDELTITGDNFDFEISRNKVYFGNIEATITYADKNTLVVTVPDDLESSSEQIKVIAQLQEVVFNENFQLIPPEINFVPQDVYANQDITIQGSYFHPILDRNNITIEDIEVDLTAGNTESLETKIPLGPFPRRKAIVKIQLLDIIVEHELELNILDKWIMISNNLPFSYNRSMGGASVIYDKAFIISPSKEISDSTYYLWSYDYQTKNWNQKNLPFEIGINESGGVLESNGVNLYVYLPNGNNDFWEYNYVNDSWSKKSSFIGNRRDGATHFSINDDIYIGIGKDFSPYIPINYKDLYKYDPSLNQWEKLSDVPFGPYEQTGRFETASFVISGIGYFSGGALSTGDTNCWSYNPQTDTWARIADFETPRSYTSSFSLNGFGYVSGGSTVGGGNRKDCWKYDPSSNSWTQIDNVGHIERGGHFSFVINGKAYVGGGGIYNSGGFSGYDFYEFIP